MHRQIFLFSVLIAVCLLSSCQKISSRQDLEKIQALEKKADGNREAASMGAAELDSALLADLGKAYLDWADKYPAAPETPEFLFRAGELYSNELQNFPKRLRFFSVIIKTILNTKPLPMHCFSSATSTTIRCMICPRLSSITRNSLQNTLRTTWPNMLNLN
jgi:hypothetical protein